jgi:peptidoglycan/xylan/chitin deacetylase (PgdA/CDA1 family)
MMERVVRGHDMRMAMWDVSTKDKRIEDPHKLADSILNKVKPGSIIDLHDGIDGQIDADRSVVVKALPLILAGLKERHLLPVRLDRLVGGGAYQPCSDKS